MNEHESSSPESPAKEQPGEQFAAPGEHPSDANRSAPVAAPDVAAMVKRLNTESYWLEAMSADEDRFDPVKQAHLDKLAELQREAAAMIEKLGQGWIPVTFENAKEVVELIDGRTLGREGEVIYNVERWGKVYQLKLPDLPPPPERP